MDIEECKKCRYYSNRQEKGAFPANCHFAMFDYCNLYEQMCFLIKECKEAISED